MTSSNNVPQQTGPLNIEQALHQAISHHQAGRWPEAERLYRAILQAQPRNPDANHNLGVLAGARQPAAGLPYLKTALEAIPLKGNTGCRMPMRCWRPARLREALNVIQTAMQRGLNTPAAQALRQKTETAVLKTMRRRHHRRTPKSISLSPCSMPGAMGTGKPGALAGGAVSGFRVCLEGVGGIASGARQRGLPALQKATELLPDDAEAHSNLGNALKDLGQLDDAVASYRRALEIKPDYAEAHNNLGNALKDLGQLDDAVASYRRALEIKPDYAEAHNNLGNALKDLGQLDDAVASYRRALEIKPDYAEAHNNLGNALQDLGQLDDAVASYRRALEIKPDYAEAHNNLGHALRDLGLLDEAEACYRRVLEMKSDYIPGVATPAITALFPLAARVRYFSIRCSMDIRRLPRSPDAIFRAGSGWINGSASPPNTANPNWRKHLVAAILRGVPTPV